MNLTTLLNLMEDGSLLHKFSESNRESDRTIYIGNNPPKDNLSSTNINYQTLFRLPASQHQKYCTVIATEDDFATHINWQQELDEMIRLIGREGKIIIRCGNSLTHNIFSIKNFLGRRLGLKVRIENESPLWAQKMYNREEWKDCDYQTITVFKIQRKNLEIYQSKLWTFAILTLGNKATEVEKFCASIRVLDKEFKHQILISGPENHRYKKYKVNYISEINKKYKNDQYSRICKKKNIIINEAKNQNLLICHDRYQLDSDFFIGFEKYGYDFDFLAIDTIYDNDGHWYPSYVKMSNFIHEFRWNKERYCFKKHDFAKNNIIKNIFVDGGLMIFKKDVVKQIGFNECHFHYQSEDVEISKEFAKHHIPPRANLLSKAITKRKLDNQLCIGEYISVGGTITKKRKKNLFTRVVRILFRAIYLIISNKKLIHFLEKKIF